MWHLGLAAHPAQPTNPGPPTAVLRGNLSHPYALPLRLDRSLRCRSGVWKTPLDLLLWIQQGKRQRSTAQNKGPTYTQETHLCPHGKSTVHWGYISYCRSKGSTICRLTPSSRAAILQHLLNAGAYSRHRQVQGAQRVCREGICPAEQGHRVRIETFDGCGQRGGEDLHKGGVAATYKRARQGDRECCVYVLTVRPVPRKRR